MKNRSTKKRKTRALPALLTGALITGTLASCADAPEEEAVQPSVPYDGAYNIIMITTDQERYFEAPPEGADWRARELLQSAGATFEKHYICTNMSTSSRSVMYTGQHITGTRMTDNTDLPWQSALDEDIATVGDMMREAGYYTAFKGKFHMLNEGAVDFGEADAVPEETVMQRQNGLEAYGFSDWNAEGDIAGSLLQGYHEDEYIKGDTVRWLRDTGAALNASGAPFFLAVNFVNPHDIMYYNPSGAPSAMHTNTEPPANSVYAKSYNCLPPAWEHFAYEDGGIPAHREFHYGWVAQVGALQKGEAEVKLYNDFYLNCIQDQDNSLMGLLDEIKRLGMTEKTIIILTSDHGEMGGSHGLKGKGPFMYENNIHVPLIIVHPAYPNERRISAVTSHLDIAPTVIDMTGLPDSEKQRITAGLAGHSLMPLVRGDADSVRDGALYAFGMISTLDASYNPFEAGTAPDFNKRGLLRGIVTERYKFARYFSPLNFNTPVTLDELYTHNDVELFDLENDPLELNNLAADRDANAALITEMNQMLNELIAKEIGADNGDEMAESLGFFGITAGTR